MFGCHNSLQEQTKQSKANALLFFNEIIEKTNNSQIQTHLL